MQWSRFRKMTEARSAYARQSCVYIQTDSRGQILRVGMATKGLNSRYRGGTGYAVDAAMHNSGNLVFVAAVPKEMCEVAEAILIDGEKPVYNIQTPPFNRVRLCHSGDAPAFRSHYKG
jgi:hypothetical protein